MSDAKTITDKEVPKLPWEVFPEEGDSFAGYTLGEAIGKGSFGTVFKVQSDPEVEWYEAVKILHRSGDIDKQRFLEEISRLKEIRIPGMARIHAAGEQDGHLYYCMDFIEGQTIDEYIEDGNQDKLFPLFLELCDTVQKLHQLNFVHLDIKPHNVMVNEEGQVRLLDLGISRKTGETSDISAEGFGAGTYEFAPAEQIDGKSPDKSMDVYALGCLLYTLLTSAHPKIPFDRVKREKPYGRFYSKSGLERSDLLKMCLSSDVTDIRQQNVLIHDSIAEAVMKSLREAEKRYSSVEEFKSALVKAGVLLDYFVVSYESLSEDMLSRVKKSFKGIALEFSSQFQFFLESAENLDLDEDLLISEDENNKSAFHLKSTDKVNEELVKELRRLVFEKANTSDDNEAWESSPYKSLNSYTEDEAELFFGRDSEILDIYTQIKDIPKPDGLLAVLAPSGAGKSSFLQAGVVPHFKNESWSTLFCWPGSGGFEQIEEKVSHFLKEKSDQKCLIIIDQFEEFLHDQEKFEGIADKLKNWSSLDNSIVILSLRNDFYKEYISFIELNKLPDNFYNLPQPDEINLGKMIRMPALKAHLTFERDPLSGKGLDEVLREEAMLNPESLAALSFTLDEIFNKSSKGRMSYSVYSELGGMHGAMAKRAEGIFRSLKLRTANHAFHHVFHQLIQVDENRIPRRLHAEYSKLTTEEDSKRLTDEFIKAKLFQVTNEADTNKRIVTVSHEALIQQNQDNGWRRVMYWLNRQRDNLLVRKRLAVAVNDWEENQRQSRFLYSSYGRLKEILTLKSSGWSFSDLENQFISLSYRAMMRNSVLLLFAVTALVWISISLWLESNTVSDLTKDINERKQEVSKLAQEADRQRQVLDSIRQQQSVMNNYNRLSLISSLQQSGTLPPATAISLLSEVSEKDRNWLWGQLLFKSLPNYLMLFGHEEEILSVQFSPDPGSRYLLTSSWDNTIKIWDGMSGELVKDLSWIAADGVKKDFEDARFTHDGHVVAANNDGHIYIWNLEKAINDNDLATAVKIPHDRIRKLFFSKDNKYMTCAGSSGRFSIWNWADKSFEKELAMGIHTDSVEEDLQRVYSAEISPDGKSVISAGWDGKIKKWSWDAERLTEGKVVGGHDAQIWSGTFSADGNYYLSAGRDRLAKLWDATSFDLINEYGSQGEAEHKSDVRSAVFSPYNNAVITASRDKKIRFWDLESGTLTFERQIHDNIIYDLSLSSDGKRFASVSADQLVNLCYLESFMADNQKSGKKLFHSDPVEHFDVNRDSIVTATSAGTVRLWDLYQGNLRSYFVHELGKRDILLKAFLIDDNKVLTADNAGNVHVWVKKGDDWEKESSLSFAVNSRVNDVILSSSKSLILSSFTNGDIRLIDLNSKKTVYELSDMGFKSPVISLSEDGEVLAVGDDTGRIILFDWKKKAKISEWSPHSRKIFDLKIIKFNGSDAVISSSRDGKVIISDLVGNELGSVSHGVRGDASYAAVSSDSLFMATSSARDNNVFIWDLKNNIELLPLSGHEEPISQVEFVNGDLIISASRDGTVRLWYSLSWEQLRKTLRSSDMSLSSEEMLQKAVRTYLYGSY